MRLLCFLILTLCLAAQPAPAKAASKREESQTRLSIPEREQSRAKVSPKKQAERPDWWSSTFSMQFQ